MTGSTCPGHYAKAGPGSDYCDGSCVSFVGAFERHHAAGDHWSGPDNVEWNGADEGEWLRAMDEHGIDTAGHSFGLSTGDGAP